MSAKRNPALVGIEVRHERSCSKHGQQTADCRCRKSYRGAVWRGGRSKKGPWLPTLAAARGWRTDELRRADLERERGGDPLTIREGLELLLSAAEKGHVRNRSGDVFKSGVVAEYRRHVETRIAPRWGDVRVAELEHDQLQAWVGELLAEGLSPSTVRNVLMPLRTLYREAATLGLGRRVDVPTRGLRLPAVRGRRERIVPPGDADALIRALEPRDRALWASAFYLGLRVGELAALRGDDLDLAARRVQVHPERGSYDWKTHEFGPPKSRAGVRTVPVVARLATELAALDGRRGLLFGRDAETPFAYWGTLSRAKRCWSAAGLEGVTFHEARHTFASFLIAAQVKAGVFNPKRVQALMGHSTLQETYDRYGHLFPGDEGETAEALDAYLAASPVEPF